MYSERCRFSSRCVTGMAMHWLQRCCRQVARIAAGSGLSSLPHPMPIPILGRTRPSLRWERISVSHSIATAASPTAANDVGSWQILLRKSVTSTVGGLLNAPHHLPLVGQRHSTRADIGHGLRKTRIDLVVVERSALRAGEGSAR